MQGRTFLLLVASALVACGNSSVGTNGDTTSGTTTGSGTGGDTSTGTGGSGSGTTTATRTTPDPKLLPTVTGTCPDFTAGKNTFSPAGIAARDVLIWGGTGKGQPGPLVFFWHGAGGDPGEAPSALGEKAMSGIQAAGGLVAAPYHDPASSFLPWYLCLGGSQEDDLKLADEILACAVEKGLVDTRRIHSVGFSAGAMNTEQFSARRSGWLASEVVYSGAQLGEPPVQDPTNKYPAMLFFGGPNDQVIVNFADATKTYHEWMTTHGHFSFMCNHNMGHTVPQSGMESAYQFLQDHPFGAPETYAKGLPSGFPSYCSL